MKRFLVTLLIMILVLGGLLYGANAYVVHQGARDIAGTMMPGDYYQEQRGISELTAEEPLDCILVLGCGLAADGGPSPMLEDRLKVALFLYEQGYAEKVLLTGDNGQVEYNEVQAMRTYMEEAGLPERAIVCDYAGFSTYDSLYRAQNIFGVKRAIVVTQEYHLYRALFIGRKLGMEVYGAAANQEEYAGQRSREVREIIARDKDLIKSWIKPEAKIMGDPIEL